MKEEIRKTIRSAPGKPGVYLWKKSSGRILYVGKAKNLKNRLGNYLNPADAKTLRLVESADKVETVITKNDLEALILEDALVKQNQPRYNVRLKDDKRYPYIKVTVGEKWPAVQVVRRVALDGSRYFGPYVDAGSVKRIVRLVSELFGVRTCSYDLNRLKRPCIKYGMGKCCAPLLVTGKKEYAKRVVQACDFLSGNQSRVKKRLVKDIKKHSESLEYEKASILKQKLESIKSLSRVQDVSSASLPDMDVLGYNALGKRANICQLKIRGHRVAAVLHHRLKGEYMGDCRRSMKAFIKQHYATPDMIPRLTVVSCEPEDRKDLEAALSKILGRKAKIQFSMRGKKRKLVEMAVENSLHQLKAEKLGEKQPDRTEVLKKALRLSETPRRIEGYDISNLGGKQTVGGMVVFTQGKPDKSQYRRFRIRGEGQDDPKNMAEMIKRRFGHDEWPRPDLVLIDGGKTQLNAAAKHVPPGIKVYSIAKRDEELYTTGVNRPIRLRKDSPSLLLLMAVRDESHRFSKSYHEKRRGKEFLKE